MSLRDYLFHEEPGITLYCGDARVIAPLLPAVQTIVTSPPYWGLRDYGTGTWEGGLAECDHKGAPLASSSSSLAGYTSENVKIRTFTVPFKDACGKCGARRIDAQLGLEPTPEQYVAALVAVFAEVKRVLREDGTLWLNLGDSYNAYNGNAGPSSGFSAGSAADTQRPHLESGHGLRTKGLKPKDLVGIPWRVAFALQADGWYLRSDIIWAKPNPMPESVTDRPTKAHEYLFLMAKSERYVYDAEAIKEPAAYAGATSERRDAGRLEQEADPIRFRTRPTGRTCGYPDVRNRRSVWTVATEPYPDAHFATFPPDLIKPCILAGAPAGGVVLDPFAGAGTTLYVAKELGRQATGIELNPAYAALAVKRLRQEVLPL